MKDDSRNVELSLVFDAVACKTYICTDKPDWLRRAGFIAQDVQAACATAGVPDMFTHDATEADGAPLLGLDYRLCCILCSKLKQTESRLATLESTVA